MRIAGIKHGDWFNNVLIKYQKEIEQDFGVIRFENGKPRKGSRGGRPERFAWLNEEQATVLMTYSRNTERVRRCKRNLAVRHKKPHTRFDPKKRSTQMGVG